MRKQEVLTEAGSSGGRQRHGHLSDFTAASYEDEVAVVVLPHSQVGVVL